MASLITAALWNLNRLSIAELVGKLASLHSLNLLILLEAGESTVTYLDTLANHTGREWFLSWSACERITVLTTFPDSFITAIEESRHYTIRHITLPGFAPFLLAAAHLRSQLHQTSESAAYQAIPLVEKVLRSEESCGHNRTLLVGDFNMDPYHPGILATHGAHAMMTRSTASNATRVVDGKTFPMFYNPMWGLFGDNSVGPPGTYRYWSSEHVCPEWHIFDQVLIRPALIPFFPLCDLQVLDSVGDIPLLSASGHPEPSDHLPVVFTLQEIEPSL